MLLQCEIQLSRHPEMAGARFITYDSHDEPQEEVWMVFREALEYDESTLVEADAWGIDPPTAVEQHLAGTAYIHGELAGPVDGSEQQLITVRIPTADQSDAWRIMRVSRDDVYLECRTVVT